MGFLARRLPGRQDVLYALGGVVFVIYTWALRGFFYQLSSFLLFHSLGDILAIFAYMMALALLESILAMAALLGLAVVLPPVWFRNGFGYKAFLTLLVAGAGAVALEHYLTKSMTEAALLYGGLGLALLALVGLILFFEYAPRLKGLLLNGLERLQVFTYLYVPIGVLSLLVVFIRNLG
jgi:hypothetical protein